MSDNDTFEGFDAFGRRITQRTLTRRTVLRGGVLGAAGLATAALIGCGDDDDDQEAAVAPAPAGGADSSDDDAATEEAAPGFIGELVQDPSLPYPFNFPEPNVTPKKGGRLRFLYTFDPGPLDPTVASAGGTQTAVNAVYNRVIGLEDGPLTDPFAVNRLTPELAASWERNPDGTVNTFHLQPGVKFQNIAPLNGRDLVAEDVKFAYERYAAEGVHTSLFAAMGEVEVVDPLTVVIRLVEPSPDFLLPLSSAFTTIHPHELVDDGSISRVAIGTGPMILKNWESGVGGTFDTNREYWEREVLIDGWDVIQILDGAARTAAFRAEQVDYGHTTSSIAELNLILGTNPETQVFTSPIFNSTFTIAMNLNNPKFQDERIRQAIMLAADQDTIAEIIYGPLGKTLPTMDWRFAGFESEPTVESGALGPWWRHDIAEAKQLLTAAGAENFKFDLVYYNYSDDANGSQNEILVDQLRQAGIEMSLSRVDYTQFNSQWTTRKTVEAADGWLAQSVDPTHFNYGLHYSESSGNRWNINDPDIDAWTDQHRVELDEDVRKDLARKTWDRLLEKVYRVEKPTGFGFRLMQPWLRGVRYSRGAGSGHHYIDTGKELKYAWLDK